MKVLHLELGRDIPVTTVVEGAIVAGTITSLYMNGLEIRIEDGSGRVKDIHAPHFQIANPNRRYTTDAGVLSEHGRKVAEELLRGLHESRS